MASIVTELMRRRFGGAEKGGAKIATGTFTQSGGVTLKHLITHNLNSSQYIVVFRNTNVRTGVNGVMEGWLFVGFLDSLNVVQSNVKRTITGFVAEARSGSTTYYKNLAVVDNGSSDSNDATLYARNSSYGFIDGDTYEWMAISLDGVLTDTLTLTSSSTRISLTNSEDSINVLAMAIIDGIPTFNVNSTLCAIVIGGYFVVSGLDSVVFEVRSTWNYSNLFNGVGYSVTTSIITLTPRANLYPFPSGNYKTTIIRY